jgi:hypothetical protein
MTQRNHHRESARRQRLYCLPSKSGSTLAVLFNGANQFYSNAVVTTARNNSGIEAWMATLTTAQGTYLIVHKGNTAANGWGILAGLTSCTAPLRRNSHCSYHRRT